MTILVAVLIYVAILFGVSLLLRNRTSSISASASDYYAAARRTPWYILAIGLLGDSISGVTFCSVPGMVSAHGFTYMWMVVGYFFGYIVVAYVLLPLYYRQESVSIYGYLGTRFSPQAQRIGSFFFILSRLIGTAAKMYLISFIVWQFGLAAFGIEYWQVVAGTILVVYLYSVRSGMKTLVWTDALQTVCIVAALVIIMIQAYSLLPSEGEGITASMPVFILDWASPDNFLKQFVSGILIVIAMTGLDQNIMQKNLAHSSLPLAQRSMLWYGFGFIPLNFLLLLLGAMLYNGFNIPPLDNPDGLLPTVISTGALGTIAAVCFALGIVAATFSNVDTVITSITTSVCVDILRNDKARTLIHTAVSLLLFVAVMIMSQAQGTGALSLVLKAASYTYGPLLGLYAFGMLTSTKTRSIAPIAIAAPLLCYATEQWLASAGYKMGYEVLLLNGTLTFALLYILRAKMPEDR